MRILRRALVLENLSRWGVFERRLRCRGLRGSPSKRGRRGLHGLWLPGSPGVPGRRGPRLRARTGEFPHAGVLARAGQQVTPRSPHQPDWFQVKWSFQIAGSRRWSVSRHSFDSTRRSSDDRNQPGACRLRIHSSGSPALRRPSDIHGKSGSRSRINLTVSFGFTSARLRPGRLSPLSAFPSKA